MKIIGLTGTTGSGKGMVGRLLRCFGCYLIDTDALYHDMICSDSPLSREIIARFGEDVALENGGIFRPRLAEIVFSDAQSLSDLNDIAHSYVHRECDTIIQSLSEDDYDTKKVTDSNKTTYEKKYLRTKQTLRHKMAQRYFGGM